MIYNKATLLLLACSQAKASTTGSLRKRDVPSSSIPRRLIDSFDDCLVVKSFVEYNGDKKKNQEICSCLLDDSTIAELTNLDKKTCTKLNSLESTISSLSGFTFDASTGSASVPIGAMLETTTIEREESEGWKPDRNRRRRLMTGEKKILIVRADASDSGTDASEAKLSEEILGFGGNDAVNLSSQVSACSYGQLTFVPSPIAVGGSYTVTIVNNVVGADNGSIRNAMSTAWQADLGTLTSNRNNGNLDYVMYCIPPGTNGSWIAYAYIDHWLSVYNNNWCLYPSSQMHEVGHNLNLAHSGEGSNEYADQSGMMGFSYSQDEGPIMCYNAVKTYKLGWFPNYTQLVDSSDSFNWQGDLIGFVDKNVAEIDDEMIFRLIPESGDDEYYVHFNRRFSFNSGTTEAGNQVMVTSRPRGLGYADSYVQAKLSGSSSYTISNFGSNGPLTITVGDITLSSTSKSSANVTIQYGNAPTDAPAVPPSNAPVVPPTDAPVAPPTDAPSVPPTDAPIDPPTDAPVVPPTDSPVVSPTDSPVVSPTDLPIVSPTDAPVVPPTDAPVAPPTDSPVVPPTDAPIVAPTDAPEPCTQCSNNETPWLINNGKDCETAFGTLKKRCNKNTKWRNNKYCQESCFVNGYGYDGDNCCIESTPPPAPVAPEPCTQCSNTETPWMIKNDLDCTTATTIITRNCNKKRKWKIGKYCQESCFDAGLGYAGDNCCSS